MNNENDKKLRQGAFWTLAGNAMNVVPWVLEAYLARKFGLSIWGTFLAAQAIVFIAGRISLLGLDKAMLWYLPQQQNKHFGVRITAMGTSFFVFIIGLGAAALIIGPLHSYIFPSKELLTNFTTMVILSIPAFCASEVFIGALQGIHKFQYRAILRDFGTSIYAPIAILLSLTTNLGSMSIPLSYVAGHFIILILSIWLWKRETKNSLGGHFFPNKAMLAYSLPIGASESIIGWTQRYAIVILTQISTPAVVGAFGIIANFAQMLTIPRRAFETAIISVTAKESHNRSEVRRVYGSISNKVMSWQFPIALIFAGAGMDILFIYNDQMHSKTYHICLFLMVIANYLSSSTFIGSPVLSGLGYSKLILINTIVSSVLGTLFYTAIIPQYGIIGAGVAALLSAFLIMSILSFEMRRFADLPAFPDGLAIKTIKGVALLIAVASLRVMVDAPYIAWLFTALLFAYWIQINTRFRFDFWNLRRNPS